MAKKAEKRVSIMACTEDGSPVVEVYSITAEEDKLIMDCKALGSMRMNVVIGVEDVAKGWPVIMESKGAILSFGKKIPSAVRRWKKRRKQESTEIKPR